MVEAIFHQLETERGQFDYLAVSHETVELSIDGQAVQFNLQTAEQIIDILGGYCEDSRRARADYYSEIDRMRDSIKQQENGNGI